MSQQSYVDKGAFLTNGGQALQQLTGRYLSSELRRTHQMKTFSVLAPEYEAAEALNTIAGHGTTMLPEIEPNRRRAKQAGQTLPHSPKRHVSRSIDA